MELYVRSWNCIPALGTALKLIEMPSISWNCIQPWVTLGKLGSPFFAKMKGISLLNMPKEN